MGTSKIKVAFSYIAYPVAMARYMLEALERRQDVELWVTGPYTGRKIPWMGGMFLPLSYVKEPDFPLPFGQPPTLIYPFVEKQLPWKPDIWIEGNAGLATQGRPKTTPYVVIGTDPHVLDYDTARAKADLFYSMQKPYMKPGDKWLPYGYDPVYHQKTTKPWEDRQYDVSLVGLPYPERQSLMNQLAQDGIVTYLDNGPAYEDAWRIYNDTRIGLNLSSRQDTTARVFELMAMGLPAVLNIVPDLATMFPPDCFAGFRTAPGAIEIIKSLLDNPHYAQGLGKAGYRAVQPHSWDSRMQQVLLEAGIL